MRVLELGFGRTAAFKIVALLALGSTLSACVPGTGSAFMPSVCVTAPGAVAAGTAGSFYVAERGGVVHFSKQGKVLGRIPVGESDFAVNHAGDVYYSSGKQIVETSPTGAGLRRWQAGTMEPEAVNPRGDVLTYRGGAIDAGEGTSVMQLFSPTGKLLQTWHTIYGPPLAYGPGGFIYALSADDGLTKLDPHSLALVARDKSLTYQFSAITASPSGAIYLGSTGPGDVPFLIQSLSNRGATFNFKTLNSSEETVGSLAVTADGSIYVVRSSYDEPGPADTALFKLSSDGGSQNKFAFCKKH